MTVIFLILILALICDTIINSVADLVKPQVATELGISLFIVIAIIYWIGQYVILEFVKWKSEDIRRKTAYVKNIHSIVTVVQYCLAAILAALILQIVLTSHYNNVVLIADTMISMTLNFSLMALFALRFFTWYKTGKSSVIVLLYGLAFVAISITSGIAVVMDSYNLLGKQSEISAQSAVVFPSFNPGTILYLPHEIYHYADLVAFVLTWLATVMLLRHYSRTLGNIKFWIVISLPLIYYLSTLIDFFNLYTPSTDSQYFYFYLYESMNSTAGGILFGVAFKVVGKSIHHNSIVRDYMTIAAYGFVLLFISDQVTLTDSGYPPFGFATMSFTGLSAYLILVGLYSTAVSLSQDARLRQSIRKSAIEHSTFLESIGSAQRGQEMEKEVLRIVTEHSDKMTEESGVQTSLTQDEIKDYLQLVIKEVKKGTIDDM